jgi:hypothetical protein
VFQKPTGSNPAFRVDVLAQGQFFTSDGGDLYFDRNLRVSFRGKNIGYPFPIRPRVRHLEIGVPTGCSCGIPNRLLQKIVDWRIGAPKAIMDASKVNKFLVFLANPHVAPGLTTEHCHLRFL